MSASPHSAGSSSISLPSTTTKPSNKPKPVNVFSNDGSFLERFQRSRQEEQDKRNAEEALSKKKQFADRFKNRGKRPPDSPCTDLDPNPAKKPKRDSTLPDPEYGQQARDQAGRILKNTGTGVPSLIK